MADYFAAHDTALHGDLRCTVVSPVGGDVTLQSGVYAHLAVTSPETVRRIATELQAALQAIHVGFSVTFDSSALSYTIAHGLGFHIIFPDTILRNALGHSDNTIAGTSVSSTRRPTLVIRAAIDAESDTSHPYEPSDGAAESIEDDGTPYGVVKARTRVRFSDWRQFGESRAAVFKSYATAAVPWTWEHMIEQCRTHTPFLFRGRFYRFRADGALWTPDVRERVVADWDDLWSIRVRAHDWGAYS